MLQEDAMRPNVICSNKIGRMAASYRTRLACPANSGYKKSGWSSQLVPSIFSSRKTRQLIVR